MTDIAELAGVRRPTVSNWRRRHRTFPTPVIQDGLQPLFDADQVAEWLDRRPRDGDQDDEPTYGATFRASLRRQAARPPRGMAGDLGVRLAVSLVTLHATHGPLPAEPAELALLATRIRTESAERFDPETVAAATPDLIAVVNDLVNEVGPAAAVEEFLTTTERTDATVWTSTTPTSVADLVALLAGDLTGRTVCDPAAGTGGLLLRALAGRPANRIIAIERDRSWAHTLEQRLRLHGVVADVLVSDGMATWPDSVDVVVLDPPFVSSEFADNQKAGHSPGPLDWALRACRGLTVGGHAFVVVPTWTLTRQSRSRTELLSANVLDAIVQLPPRVHTFRTGAELALLVLTAAGESHAKVLVCDTSRLPADSWVSRTAELISTRDTSRPEVCRAVPTGALKDGSMLPAHLLGDRSSEQNPIAVAQAASRDVHAAFLPADDGDDELLLDTPIPRDPAPAGDLATVADTLAGYRIPADDVAEEPAALARAAVIGPPELRGERAVGSRSIDQLAAVEYDRTRPDDIVVLTDQGVWCVVDQHGGSVVQAPARIVRLRTRPRVVGQPLPPMRPLLLARLLSARTNAARQSGSLVRRVDLKSVRLPVLEEHEVQRLETYLAELDRRRKRAQAQLDALDHLDESVSDAVALGVLRLVPDTVRRGT